MAVPLKATLQIDVWAWVNYFYFICFLNCFLLAHGSGKFLHMTSEVLHVLEERDKIGVWQTGLARGSVRVCAWEP